MANTISVLKMMDGPSHVTLHCFLKSDGVAGELVNQVLLDPATDLVPAMPRRQDLIVKQVWYELAGFSLTFAFDAPTPWPFWTLTPNNGVQHDWRFIGGIRDYSSAVAGLDSTGKLLMSTQGFTTAAASGAFILWLEKRDRPNPQPD